MATKTNTSKQAAETKPEPAPVDEKYRTNIHGSETDDALYGNTGDNFIYGLGGNDTFYGDPGSDELHGSDDTDTANYKYSTGGVRVDLLSGRGYGGYANGDRLVDIENVTGSSYRDYLYGDNEANVLDGRSGNDTLYGRGGADTLHGGLGNDTLEGGTHADILNGGSGSDTASYYGSSAAVTVNLGNAWSHFSTQAYGGAFEYVGANSAHGGDATGDTLSSIENVTGSRHDDLLIGDDGANVLRGNSGHDRLFGRDGDDTLHGNSGDDVLVAGWGVDTLYGGAGRDEVSYADAGSAVNIYLDQGYGGDWYAGGLNAADRDSYSSIEDATGSNYRDVIYGSDEANELKGLQGNDDLFGGAGADILDGGLGIDFTSYAASNAAVTVDLAAGTGAGGHAQGDTLISIENLEGSEHDGNQLYGNGEANRITSHGDHDVVDGREGADSIYAYGSGADVSGGDGADYIAVWGPSSVVSGGDGDDGITVYRAATDSVVSGGEGSDLIHSFSANTDIDGGADDDTISVDFLGRAVDWVSSNPGVTIEGGSGEDTLITQGGETTVNLQDGSMTREGSVSAGDGTGQWKTIYDSISSIENVYGDRGDDELYGDDANNIFAGRHGDDVLSGMGGNDVLNGGDGADQLIGGEGIDTADYSSLQVESAISGNVYFDGWEGVNVSLASGTGFGGYAQGDTLTGIENLIGTRWNDVLEGSAEDNAISGGEGVDILNGAGGSDVLTGGQGADTFKFELDYFGDDAGRITDFEQGVDQIDLRGLDYFTSIDQVLENIEGAGSAAELNYGQSSIRIEGTQSWELTEQDFLL
ncbi:MAG: calcium-binding protein [Geminicoccaceae bacterium]